MYKQKRHSIVEHYGEAAQRLCISKSSLSLLYVASVGGFYVLCQHTRRLANICHQSIQQYYRQLMA